MMKKKNLVIIIVTFIIMVVGAYRHRRRSSMKEITWSEDVRAHKRALWMDTLMNDTICREQLRLNRRCFEKLCAILRSKGGLVTSRNVTVREAVAFFLHIISHNLKNRTIGAIFVRSGETISRQFHTVLRAVMNIGKYYVKQAESTTSYAGDNKWKWFEVIIICSLNI